MFCIFLVLSAFPNQKNWENINDLAGASEEVCQRVARDEEGEEERRASEEEETAQGAQAHPREANGCQPRPELRNVRLVNACAGPMLGHRQCGQSV